MPLNAVQHPPQRPRRHGAPDPVADLDQWREWARPFFDIRPLTEPAQFAGRAGFHRAGGLTLSQVRFSPQRMEHDPVRLAGFNNEYLLLERYHSGEGRGLAAEATTRIGPGTLHLVDMSRRYVTMTTQVAAEGVLIPHDAVGYDPSRDPAYLSLPASSAQGRLLMLALEALRGSEATCPDAAQDLAAALCDLVGHLIATACEGDGDGEAAARGRARLLRRYIADHLDDPELTVERLCRDLGMSRATLYRQFCPDGGARQYITGLRLDRCFAELTRTPGGRGEVRRVAERWGFFDAANFHHSFRRRFGLAPSDCLGPVDQPTGAEPTTAPASILSPALDWMRAN